MKKEPRLSWKFRRKKVDQKFDDAKQLAAAKEELSNHKAELIKCMFIFWIGQVTVDKKMFILISDNCYFRITLNI